jgi:hypothetical protein
MSCIRVFLVVGYVFAVLKTLRQCSKCRDIAEQNLKEGVTYRREIFFEPDKFTEKGLRFRRLCIRYATLSMILCVGAILLTLIFGKSNLK